MMGDTQIKVLYGLCLLLMICLVDVFIHVTSCGFPLCCLFLKISDDFMCTYLCTYFRFAPVVKGWKQCDSQILQNP